MKTFVVLGMHRSATSLIAKSLAAELDMGDDLLPAGYGNPQGHYESMPFLKMNMKILRVAGGTWDNPPPVDNILQAGEVLHDEIADTVATSLNRVTGNMWGWKDPRTSLTAHLWHPFLPNPHYICCFRKPFDVATSLMRRDNMPLERGIALCNLYNERIMQFLNDYTTQ